MIRRTCFPMLVALIALAAPAAANATILSFSVNSTADETTSGDGCSLREAISAANAGTGTADCLGTPSATSVVYVPAGHYRLTIAPTGPDDNNTGDLNITNTADNVTIQGASARTTLIDANGIDRAFMVAGNAVVTIDSVTITGGRAPDSPAVANGGGILNDGTLTVSNSTITGNRSGNGYNNSCNNCLAGSAGGGGGISNFGFPSNFPPTRTGSLQVVGSTISENMTGNGGSDPTGSAGAGGEGAGIESLAPLTVSNSTITGNQTGSGGTGAVGGSNGGDGGGILSASVTTVSSSTIADNFVGAGANANGHVGGVDQANGSVALSNVLLASNAAGNCGGTIGDGGHNLSFPTTDTSCPHTFLSGDPVLGALADNGGPTDTMSLGSGSAAADQVPPTGSGCLAVDQRGVTRPQGPLCDIGALERVVPPTLAPSSLKFPLAAGATQAQGTIGPAQTLTLTRPSGIGTTAVTGVTVSGPNAADFLISGDGCTGKQLTGTGAGQSCQVSVRFAPGTRGPEHATLSILDTNGPVGSAQTASLSGHGGAPATGQRLIALFFAVNYRAITGHPIRFSYFATDTATVTITIRHGRKIIAALKQNATPGRDTIKFSTTARGRALPAGSYQLALSATGEGQTASDHAQLTLVKPPARHH